MKCAFFADDPNREAHPATLSGTRCHEALEDPDKIDRLSAPERDAVDEVRGYLAALLARSDFGLGMENEVTEKRELTVDVTADVWGHLDLVLAGGGWLHVIDYKFGRNLQTPAKDNLQLFAYGIGALKEFPDAHTVVLHILYPLLDHADPYVLPAEVLRTEKLALVEAAVQKRKNALAGVGSPTRCDLCAFCRFRYGCSAWAESPSDALAVTDLNPWTIDTFDGETAARVLAAIPLLEDRLKETRRLLAERVAEGDLEIPGYRLQTNKGSILVVDTVDTINLLLAAGVAWTDIEPKLKLSIAALCDELDEETNERLRDSLLSEGACTLGKGATFLRKAARKPEPKNT